MGYVSGDADRISNLPEEMCSHILSLMPTRFAVRTSILSKRWRYTWTFVHNLYFDDVHSTYGLACFSFVDRVLKLCKTTQVKIFRLDLPIPLIQKSTMSEWISAAISLKVSELDIYVKRPEFPSGLFTCNTLKKFKLRCDHSYCPFTECPSSVNFPCLKTLDVDVGFSESFDDVFKVIYGCPVLENLSLVISCFDNKEVFCLNIPTLKRLSIVSKVSNFNKVVLKLPNLEYLCVDGISCSSLLMENLSSVVEAKVSCGITYDQWVELLQGISGAKSLSLTIQCRNLPNNPMDSCLPKLPNLKHLELKGNMGAGWMLIPQFLESSSKLEHLCIEKPNGGWWIEPKSLPTCMLTNLKTVNLKETRGDMSDNDFLMFLLGNSKFLKTLTVTCDTFYPLNKRSCCMQNCLCFQGLQEIVKLILLQVTLYRTTVTCSFSRPRKLH